MNFEHDKLVAHVQHVNPRTERHGEDEVLACDVKFRLMQSENAEHWESLLTACLMGAGNAADRLGSICDFISVLPFDVSFADHKVNVWQGNRKPATFIHAKVNKLRWSREAGAERIDLRVQSEANGETVGAISALLDQKVRLEIVAQQGELPLDEGGEDGGE